MIHFDHNILKNSVRNSKRMNNQDRQRYYAQLLDMYDGFSGKYVDAKIRHQYGLHGRLADQYMNSKMIFNFLNDLIEKISRVYKNKPNRTFYIEGKKLVEELPEGANPDKYYVDSELVESINRIYSNTLNMRICEAERMSNLFNTAVYVVSKRAGIINLNIVLPEDCLIVEDPTENTKACEVHYRVGVVNPITGNNDVGVDSWVLPNELNTEHYRHLPEELQNQPIRIDKTKKDVLAVTNEFAVNMNEMLKEKYKNEDPEQFDNYYYNGDIFPPFVAFRSGECQYDFWGTRDQDLIESIIQLHMQWARFIILLGTTSHPWVVAKNISDKDTLSTIPGTINKIGDALNMASGLGGDSSIKASIDTINTQGQIKEVLEALQVCTRQIYALHGINTNDIIASGQKQSAESKAFDTAELKARIASQRDRWRDNETQLFETIKCVWNASTPNNQIPPELSLKIDFDEHKNIEEETRQFELDLLKLGENLTNHVEMIMKQSDYELSPEEATRIFEENKKINESNTSVFDLSADTPEEEEEEENEE